MTHVKVQEEEEEEEEELPSGNSFYTNVQMSMATMMITSIGLPWTDVWMRLP